LQKRRKFPTEITPSPADSRASNSLRKHSKISKSDQNKPDQAGNQHSVGRKCLRSISLAIDGLGGGLIQVVKHDFDLDVCHHLVIIKVVEMERKDNCGTNKNVLSM
jgi:hypothetical protein